MDQALWSAPEAATGREVAAAAAGYRRLGVLRSTTSASWPRCWSTDPDGEPLLITKGAPEVVLDRCANVPAAPGRRSEALFADGARVVAVATRPADGLDALTADDEQELALVGFLTFADRPKADAGASIAQLHGSASR